MGSASSQGHKRWRWDLNPRRGCPLTRFRVPRRRVHHRPRTYVTWAEGHPAFARERPRTGVNETETETEPERAIRAAARLEVPVSIRAICWAPNPALSSRADPLT